MSNRVAPARIQAGLIVSLLVAAVVIAAPPAVGEGGNGETVSRIRLRSYPQTDSEKAAYTIRMDSPWENGGYLHVNFPEHLEYGPVGYTITRYSDPRPPAWQVEREGKFAHYEVASIPGRGVEGVRVQAATPAGMFVPATQCQRLLKAPMSQGGRDDFPLTKHALMWNYPSILSVQTL